jgi:endo-1,4-beta-xylanase
MKIIKSVKVLSNKVSNKTLSNASKKMQLFTLLSCCAALFIGVNANAQIANGKSKFLGNITANDVPSNFSTYWNQVTPENGTKWGEVEGTRNQMNWGAADTAYNFAHANGYKFKFHTFVWGSQEPGWLGGLSNTDKKAELEQYMQLACQRFKPDMIDVVNEPLHAPSNMRDAIGGSGSTGWDWVIWSFQKARQYCPNAKLLINDYGLINDSNAIKNYKVIVKLLKDRGLIDGVGMQNHLFNIDDLDPNLMRENLALLVQTGVPLYSSEWDMSGDDAQQLARYKAKFPIVWESPDVVGVTLWGYREGATWRSGTHLIRADGSERPAMTWLKSYIAGGGAVSSSSRSSSSSASSIGGGSTPPAGQVMLRARHSNSCVDAAGSGSGANVQQWSCWSGANQKWTFNAKGNGWYEIKGAQSGRCLDVSGSSTSNGANIQLYDCTGGNNQQFKLTARDGGYYNLTARHSNACVDVSGPSTANGANVHQWGCYNGTNQQFKFN